MMIGMYYQCFLFSFPCQQGLVVYLKYAIRMCSKPIPSRVKREAVESDAKDKVSQEYISFIRLGFSNISTTID